MSGRETPVERGAVTNVLAVDTATEVLALGLSRGSARAALCLRRGLQHSPALLPLVSMLLDQLGMKAEDLHLVVCSLGPGSFTGIRIGLATALGISGATGLPVVGVSTLDALAEPWRESDRDIFPVIDARKGKIYTARFRAGRRQTEYLDLTPRALVEALGAADRPLLIGPDSERIRGMLGDDAAATAVADLFDPAALLRLGVETYRTEGADPARLRPLYLRKSEAEIASGL
ncbi:MAG TPA: tRNA (adenosine(37)-N6)-threonylcarbamoyltransferase complex dimerization subunit type 1 TsaB [Spirochaetia bacterium]|nr:tRNA (adenosine(37)-N6)-threonylcarbamoyltransferase complex dimerization subunit type 1 TsaB [Spirochaetia bacterium]